MPNTRKNPLDSDSPFVTEDFFRNARTFKDRFPGVDASGGTIIRVDDDGTRHVLEQESKTNVPVTSELVRELRATGPDWMKLAEEMLRAGLKERESKAA